MRRIWSIKEELIAKSREAALCAVKVINDPLIQFKSETYIVLMIIAWTYLLHAYYRAKDVEYRYFKLHGTRRFFDKTKYGAYKYWELERCLNCEECPLDKNTSNNLRFLIGLRHEIEHQMTLRLDDYLSGRFQACAMNFNECIKQLFGNTYGLDNQLTYSLQFVDLTDQQLESTKSSKLPKKILKYIEEFDGSLDHEEYNSPNYSYRLIFKKKLVNRPGQADRVIEFIDPKSKIAEEIDKEYWVKKEVERKKYRPSHIVEEVQGKGFSKFRINPEHVNMWKSEDAKNPGKGYGTEVEGTWYWYDTWLKKVLELCESLGDMYK